MNISKEDYIKAIYELGGYARLVPNKEIATKLKVSAPSVSEMVKKLVLEGYLNYQEYVGVGLTDRGIKLGQNVRRRHLLWEVFLVDYLGYSWDQVNEKAEKLEHVTDSVLEARLDKFLNYPIECPHGAPILIDHGGDFRTLMDLRPGDIGQVLRFQKCPDLEEFLRLKQLEVDDLLELLDQDGSQLIFSNGESKLRLDPSVASKIFIK